MVMGASITTYPEILRGYELLLELMRRNKILNWNQLQQKTGLSSAALWRLRDGDAASLSLDELSRIALCRRHHAEHIALSIPLGNFLDKLGILPPHPELEIKRRECLELQQQLQQLNQEKETLRKDGLRLHSELQQQQLELTQEFRKSTFEKLQTLLVNYPSIDQMVKVKPELPAKNLLSSFTPLENLLKEWDYQPIGKPWEQVEYNPQIHQPDTGDIAESEMVYIRFIGYQHQGNILCPAKVSRTLPGAGK
ncbi:helix-turn-helix domain-containing protein [Calothrix sp. CCY 0018]|uniref:helix-turn-helix domain-containing protein n=1 Tax=Calothrix sp. CCY 0018 TaxID=3103864 RepID=UPI0039C6A276